MSRGNGQGLHYKKDGSLDMRYSSSKAAASSSSYGSPSDLRYKKDGSLDMRYKSSREASSCAAYGDSYRSSAVSPSNLHYKKDGSLDMRYSSSKAAASSSSYGSPNDLHYKKDGSLDMRYKSSREASSSVASGDSHRSDLHYKTDQGEEFWSAQSRVVRACTEGDFSDFEQSRAAPKLRKPTVKDCNVLGGRSREMIEMRKAISPAGELKEVVDALTCIICKDAIQRPVASGCCKSLIGCKTCCDLWFRSSSRCPKCNTEGGRDNQLQLTGLDDTFKLLLPVTSASQ